MPSQALSRLQKLAGINMPARYETLGNLLDTCLNPDTDTTDIRAAIELDPAILAAFLSFRRDSGRLETWHRDIPSAFFPALATAMAQQYLCDPPDDDNARGRLLAWRHAMLHSLLADRLSRDLAAVDEDEARLAGLLAPLGSNLLAFMVNRNSQPFNQMVERSAHDKAEMTAGLLAYWGCEPGFCDAVRYQHVPLAQLADTSALIRVVAVAGHLIEFVEGPDLLKPNLAREIQNLLGFDEDHLYAAIGKVSNRFDEILLNLGLTDAFLLDTRAIQYPPIPQTDSRSWCRFRHNVSEATLGAIFQNALTRAGGDVPLDTLMRDTGRFLFGFNGIVHLTPRGKHLGGAVGTEKISIKQSSPESFIAKCYRNGNTGMIAAGDISAVADRQLLDRTGGHALQGVFLSEAAGVLACGVDSEDGFSRKNLLPYFAEAVADLYTAAPASQSFNPDVIQARLREIVHEANNPLSVVQNYLRTLSLRLDGNEKAQQDITTISNEIMRAADIIRKFASIDFTFETVAESIDVNDLVTKLVNLFKGGEDEILFKLELDRRTPTTVAPVDNVRQILVNLIKNASEALGAGPAIEADRQITVSTCASVNLSGRNFVEISVADNGPGIPFELRGNLFDAQTSLKGGSHSGLGLSIARQLTDEMGGMITCRSKTSEEGMPGTTFQVLIPEIGNNEIGNNIE